MAHFKKIDYWAKRGFDLCLGYSLFLLTSPVLLTVMIIIRLQMGAPIIYTHKRPGLNGKPFCIYKLRTMTDAKDDAGILLSDDKRLTSLGRFLRKTSIDELPELINVIKGDMSMVGPRPLLMRYLPLYSAQQVRRHEIKPGLTGWAQINGRNALSWDQKFNLDTWYVDNHNLGLDLKVIAVTIKKVLCREGISHAGEATMPEFKGSSTVCLKDAR